MAEIATSAPNVVGGTIVGLFLSNLVAGNTHPRMESIMPDNLMTELGVVAIVLISCALLFYALDYVKRQRLRGHQVSWKDSTSLTVSVLNLTALAAYMMDLKQALGLFFALALFVIDAYANVRAQPSSVEIKPSSDSD